MAYCRNCGKEMGGTITCPNCGARHEEHPPVEDNGGFGWGLLGCCIPIVGLVLFLVWKDTKPKTAKAAGIGALVCVGCEVLIYLIALVSGVAFAALG